MHFRAVTFRVLVLVGALTLIVGVFLAHVRPGTCVGARRRSRSYVRCPATKSFRTRPRSRRARSRSRRLLIACGRGSRSSARIAAASTASICSRTSSAPTCRPTMSSAPTADLAARRQALDVSAGQGRRRRVRHAARRTCRAARWALPHVRSAPDRTSRERQLVVRAQPIDAGDDPPLDSGATGARALHGRRRVRPTGLRADSFLHGTAHDDGLKDLAEGQDSQPGANHAQVALWVRGVPPDGRDGGAVLRAGTGSPRRSPSSLRRCCSRC